MRKDHNKLYQKYEKRLEEIVRLIDTKKIDFVMPNKKLIENWKEETGYLES